ncbi:hypothetical protein [Streptomyces sp. NBC_00057]|uniref:hypothetical protein n=1 Tax=Streptomyces sp. NBC_00057 TaxID=2975634 RepID=UPI003243FD4A
MAQDLAHVGVAVMAKQGRPGYTCFRTPYVSDADAAYVAEATSHQTADPDLRLDALLDWTGRAVPGDDADPDDTVAPPSKS